MLDDAFHFLVQAQEAPDWARLGQHLPYEWIERDSVAAGIAQLEGILRRLA